MRFVRFPYGRFTEAEYFAAYALVFPIEEAAREAADCAALTPDRASYTSLSLADLALLSLLSPELLARAEDFLASLEDGNAEPRHREEPGVSTQAEWQHVREQLRRKLSL